MLKVDEKILVINQAICQNIEMKAVLERGLLSQNILAQLRNFVEHISFKEYCNGRDLDITFENLQQGNKHVESNGKLKDLKKFHKLLQITTSHYTLEPENSTRLMLKYYEYLLKLKKYLKEKHNMSVLENLEKFPISQDETLNEYYEKIATKVNHYKTPKGWGGRCYIQKIKPFFVNNEIYYEITFTASRDNISKFNRHIAFTKFDIPHNYAVRLRFVEDNINIMGNNMPILIITDWITAIRICEFNNFNKILSQFRPMTSQTDEYKNLMVFLTESGFNLLDLMKLPRDEYDRTIEDILKGEKKKHIFTGLEKCYEIINNSLDGSNILRYLLYRMNNKVIKKQYGSTCKYLSDLNLEWGCIPFDVMPYCSSLIGHNPKLRDLLECINNKNREHELLAKLIQNNTDINGCLYTAKKDIENIENIDSLVSKYNSLIYTRKHSHRLLDTYKENFYIRGYEENTKNIIEILKVLTQKGIDNYTNSFEYWLSNSFYDIDCNDKKEALKKMFESSQVTLIYGSAGTGKSTLINHISNFFNDKNKLFLANTNPAVDNLKRKVKASNCTYKTIAKFTSYKNDDTSYDILIIDESSTLNNKDMLNVLNKAKFKLLVLVGDTFQIEAINFGNWFSLAKSFLPSYSIFELEKPYRTQSEKLLKLWDKVRKMDDDILEHIARENYSATLNNSIFESANTDEIILCLNYDGLYGINNINKFLQGNNKNEAIQWGIQTYKINDPILFNETDNFGSAIYNNLKGIIKSIDKSDDEIKFTVEIDKSINEMDVQNFELIGNSENGNSLIQFSVYKPNSVDDDEDLDKSSVVPFQVSYAVSIHKAQGLEYNSVKVVVTEDVEEMISHNILYTAITRAKENLKIYWTPEVEKRVLESIKIKKNSKDESLLRVKYGL